MTMMDTMATDMRRKLPITYAKYRTATVKANPNQKMRKPDTLSQRFGLTEEGIKEC